MELSLENIINRLGTSGEGTKREVLKMLKNAHFLTLSGIGQ